MRLCFSRLTTCVNRCAFVNLSFEAQAVYIDTRFFIVCYRMYFRKYENIKIHTITMAITLYKPYLHLQANRIYLKVHGKLLESQLI